ncbi:RsmB/NOP family class I SAM-dependent RNA methyltransferase [Sphingomonas sp. S1-29]|uniref:RsmB/NOP family class I SAM-dependent RNA methyltransferase n=1 Tax=Sphingomonas sp. S1-29 TaxID=2991074 RepID=UPI002240CF47|nr:RsmB/NOP family class I SAM-dependent RNA methyltransferase [Sphingomonas sp. S1-29]UZK69968.1 RsmB/NOP family class I SAM-dependent RNA methyltransferase [Sphingomonas sp. S1-29]
MTPPARVQAAIDLLDLIIAAAREGGAAADTIIARGFAARRYAGSKDRRAVRNLVYDAIRLCGELPRDGRAAMLALAQRLPGVAAAFDGSTYGPPAINPNEKAAVPGVAPAWLVTALAASGLGEAEQEALLERAPLDIRVNRLLAARDDIVIEGAQPLAFAPDALRLPPDTSVDKHPAYDSGLIEVQDAGSQLVTLACGVAPGMRVIDLCAGAGGKTLALAAAMANQGDLLATDTDRGRLQRLPPRAERAGVTIARTLLLNPGHEAEMLADETARADVVLIDAPCSGTGTWRRNPEARWRLTADRLTKLEATQARLLDLAATLVRPGGAVVYVVCSLLDAEGADQAAAFLERHPGWQATAIDLPAGTRHGAGMRLTPASDSTDGFFVAMLRTT